MRLRHRTADRAVRCRTAPWRLRARSRRSPASSRRGRHPTREGPTRLPPGPQEPDVAAPWQAGLPRRPSERRTLPPLRWTPARARRQLSWRLVPADRTNAAVHGECHDPQHDGDRRGQGARTAPGGRDRQWPKENVAAAQPVTVSDDHAAGRCRRHRGRRRCFEQRDQSLGEEAPDPVGTPGPQVAADARETPSPWPRAQGSCTGRSGFDTGRPSNALLTPASRAASCPPGASGSGTRLR